MAEGASSVASFDLLGNFAMSVVAPSLRRTCRRCPNRHDKSAVMPEGRHRYGYCAASSPIYRLMIILSPWQRKRNYAGKDFFIIVNRLVTIANAVLPRRQCAIMAAELGRHTGKRLARLNHRLCDYTALTTIFLVRRERPSGGSCIYPNLVLFRSNSPVTKRHQEADMAQAAVKIFEREREALKSEVLDRAHLARMTFNDRNLEREVLQLFDRQAELLMQRIRSSEPAAIATLAHTLKGSAAGIGAGQVARAAEATELSASRTPRKCSLAIDQLAEAVDEIRGQIATLLQMQ
jgi:HPt (histidine-containing phosphotransfer) domain-containing protein